MINKAWLILLGWPTQVEAHVNANQAGYHAVHVESVLSYIHFELYCATFALWIAAYHN